MKIALTGHTNGLGLACYNLLKQNYDVIGLSLSNGYDINDYNKIVDTILDSDVFINNAYSGYAQANLLIKLHQHWQHLPKTIISVSSTCTRFSRAEKELNHLPWEYRDHKLALERVFHSLIDNPGSCRLHLMVPGPIDTRMVKHLECTKLDASVVANAIKYMINTPELIEQVLYAK